MIQSSRKFRPSDSYVPTVDRYFLLPFRFHEITEDKEVLVNEVGDFLIAPRGTAQRVVERDISREDTLYADLVSGFFIAEQPIPDLIDVLATRYRTKKSFLDSFTSLHIFVITLRCDHGCHYCQVSRQSENRLQFDISFENLQRSIDLMFTSPAETLTVEFQGGEPLLAFDRIIYAVNQVKARNEHENRQLRFVICTNLSRITDESLEFCKLHKILISTSYDGPAFIHNSNRHVSGGNSHELTLNGIRRSRAALGNDQVSALMTASTLTLDYPIEIIDDYMAQGFTSIFLRPINPYGFAKKNTDKNMYETERFLDFYKKAILHIIELNLKGVYFVEEYATIILTKMLTPFSTGFTDLQSPSGLINSVIVYNYDGYLYASDESRMLAEEGDFTFRLGHIRESYRELFYGDKARSIAEVWSNESLPGCSECGFQTYCGADPVRNHTTQGDMVGFRPTNSFCKKNMEIIRFLFELMDQSPTIERIFRAWVNRVSP